MFEGEFEGYIDSDLRKLIERYETMMIAEDRIFFEEEEFERIIDFYEDRNQLENALHAIQVAIAQYPFSGIFLIKKASLLYDMKQNTEALSILEKAEIYDASDLELYLLRSEIQTSLEKYELAVDTLKCALSFSEGEEEEEIYLSLADVYESWEKFDKVFICLKKVLQKNPSNEDALNRIWFAVDINENYKASVKLHKLLINEDPYSYLAWYNLGQAYFGMGKYKDAAEAYEYVTIINEDYDMIYRDWGETLIRMEKYTDAIRVFEEALRVSEPYEELYFGLGKCYEKLNDLNKARFYFRKAVHMDPYYEEAFFRIGEIYKREGRNKEAMNSYRKALKLNDENVGVLTSFADLCADSGDLDQAIANYKKALLLKPHLSHNWVNLSYYLFEIGQKEEAFQCLEEASEVLGEEVQLIYLKAVFLFAGGKRSSALTFLERALSMNPAQSDLIFIMAPYLRNDPTVCELIQQYH